MCDNDDELTVNQRIEIWDRWQTRATIKGLAQEFDTTEGVIRRIISMPRRPG